MVTRCGSGTSTRLTTSTRHMEQRALSSVSRKWRRGTVRLSAGMLKRSQWLVAQNSDGSWGGYPKGSPSVEETALAVEPLASFAAMTTQRR